MPALNRLLCVALAVAMAWPAAPVRAQSSLPALGDAASGDLDLNEERRLGDSIMTMVRRDPAYLDDPVLLEYVQDLWTPLLASARRLGHIDADLERAFAGELFLVRDASVNAFALPGGHVGVHLGLIAMTARPEELASVLAHEMAHVTQRHIARSMGSAQRTGLVGMAAMLLGLIAAARSSNTDAATAAIAGGQAAMIQGQLNFSRDMEREADRIGFGTLEGAGFGIAGMASMFELMGQANRLNDSGAFPYLRSHPLTTERIAEAQARLPVPPPAMPAPPLLHTLMRVRAAVLADATTATLRRLQDAPAEGADAAATLVAQYRRAFVSATLRDAAVARPALARALALAEDAGVDAPAREAVRRLAPEVHLLLGDAPAARAAAAALQRRPGLLLRARAVRSTAAPAEPAALRASLEALQSWVTEHPQDFVVWSELSQTADAAGQPVRSQRAAAEASLVAGDVLTAHDRLRAARRLPVGAESIEMQIVEARLRQVLARLREMERTGELPRR